MNIDELIEQLQELYDEHYGDEEYTAALVIKTIEALRELTAPIDDGELELALIAYLHYVEKEYMQSGIMDAIKPTFERLARNYETAVRFGEMKDDKNDKLEDRIEELEAELAMHSDLDRLVVRTIKKLEEVK